MSASASFSRGGQPSTTTPTPPPWDSPQVVTRNRCPKVFAMGRVWEKDPAGQTPKNGRRPGSVSRAKNYLWFAERRLLYSAVMAQGLQLSQRLTQSLVLAPQLQQSLALLQAPTLELKALVEQELQQNPVLEEAPAAETELQEQKPRRGTPSEAAEAADPSEPPADLTFDPADREDRRTSRWMTFKRSSSGWSQLDQEWRDHFAQTNLPMRRSAEDEEKRQFMFDSLVAGTSLQEMLLEQVRESAPARRPMADCGNAHRQHRRLRLSEGHRRRAGRDHRPAAGADCARC